MGGPIGARMVGEMAGPVAGLVSASSASVVSGPTLLSDVIMA